MPSNTTTIQVKRLDNGADTPLPAYATDGAAGMDICAAEEVTILPGKRHAVATGLAFAIPAGFEVQVRPRSGLALKHGVTCLNSPGNNGAAPVPLPGLPSLFTLTTGPLTVTPLPSTGFRHRI